MFNAQDRAGWTEAGFNPVEHDRLARLLSLAGAAPGMRILEPGCGTGRLTRILGETVGPRGSVVALDRSARMVEIAGERCAGLPRVEVVQADVETWPLPASPFDAVVCHQVFMSFQDRPRTLRRLAQCLTPSGRLVISQFIGRTKFNQDHDARDAAAEPDPLPDESGMRALLRRAGLRVELLEDGAQDYFLSARPNP